MSSEPASCSRFLAFSSTPEPPLLHSQHGLLLRRAASDHEVLQADLLRCQGRGRDCADALRRCQAALRGPCPPTENRAIPMTLLDSRFLRIGAVTGSSPVIQTGEDVRLSLTFGKPGDFSTISRPEFDDMKAKGELDVSLGKVPLLEAGGLTVLCSYPLLWSPKSGEVH